MRTFGVEEELLLVDERSGDLASISERLLRLSDNGLGPAVAGGLTSEAKQEQIETVSAPYKDLPSLAAGIRAGRAEANRQAQPFHARVAALGTYPLPVATRLVQRPRYKAMAGRYGLTLREQLTCGFHVHVSVDSDEEAVAVLDRIRIWLPILLAISSNSPFWQGTDSGYASFRYQAWKRWPTAGPTEIFGSAAAYRSLVRMLLKCDVLLDQGMVYFDARLSHRNPTVEMRVADVCQDPDEAAVVAALSRALVETAARQWREGQTAPPVPGEILRLASWRASRSGLGDDLLHPLHNRPCPARTAVTALLRHVTPVLTETDELASVRHIIGRVLREGTGADQQRAAFARRAKLTDVVFEAMKTSCDNTTLI